MPLGEQQGRKQPSSFSRERAMLRFRQMKTLQKFASDLANVPNHFALERHLVETDLQGTIIGRPG